MDLSTRCLHGPGPQPDPTGAIAGAIYQTATFAHPGPGQSTGYDYTRSENPTREALERVLADLEGGAGAVALSSGMAALALLGELLAPGDHIVVGADLYGGTVRLLDRVTAKNGVSVTRIDTDDDVPAALTPATRLVLVETPTNPTMRILNIRRVAAALAAFAATGAERPLLAVDNTFMTPLLQRPLDLGADVVVHSATKYLAGHNDTLAGALVARDAELVTRLRELAKTTGAVLAPFDAWLVTRGLKTLAVRLERQQASAARIAAWLAAHPAVGHVAYPGLPGFPGRDILEGQATGYGAMIAFTVRTPEAAQRVLRRVRLIQYAESLGGVESLITYPVAQTHADVPVAQREALGITDSLLRLSVGLEAPEDLLDDLAQALG